MPSRSRPRPCPHRVAKAAALASLLFCCHARAEPPEDDELLAPDRLDREDELVGADGTGLWVGAAAKLRLREGRDGVAMGSDLGAGLIVGGNLDLLAAPREVPRPEGLPTGPHERPLEPSARVDAALARGAAAAARRRERARENEARLDDLATRSRTSASLPELRLRVMRVVDEDEALAPTAYDPERVTASGGTSTWLEARATWRLDRWVFTREEVAIERLRQQRSRASLALEREVLGALIRWQAARFRSLDPEALGEDRIVAELEASAAAATLDVWTDGWFSEELARRTKKAPRGPR